MYNRNVHPIPVLLSTYQSPIRTCLTISYIIVNDFEQNDVLKYSSNANIRYHIYRFDKYVTRTLHNKKSEVLQNSWK